MALFFLALGLWQAGEGLWIQSKAWLAQALIRDAWIRTLDGEPQARPWPWADTWPVARMTVPRLGVERFVLAGANGAALAFGPGHASATVPPGHAGNSLIGGHRDTHLAFLGQLRMGDEIVIERSDGVRISYFVQASHVVDRRDVWLASQQGPSRLTLITCYPLDALVAGGNERYAVIAELSPGPGS